MLTRVRYLGMALVVTIITCTIACSGDGGGEIATHTSTQLTAEARATASPTLLPTSEFLAVVTDDSGREVAIKKTPQRIVSLSAAHTEILFAIGAGGQVAAVDLFSDFPAEAQERKQLDSFTPSLESIIEIEPDLIVLFFDPGDLIFTLEGLGLPVIFLDTSSSIEEIFDQIEILGRVTGHVGEAELLTADMRERIDAVITGLEEAGKGPRIFHELDPMLFTIGPGSFIDDIYSILGAENIAANTGQAFPQLSNEAVIGADPEVIILADEAAGETPSSVSGRDGWIDISAVVNGRVHIVDPEIMSRPGPRIVEAVEKLANLLYPELLP